ncbi:unnamed protein product [Spirodela intermedia]|uniref:Transcription elongation factor n=1 Tax=Spirodela intermedia TaxID=51605 RepID=A0A7I8IW49_SPIIN|nr:unnamed protein product [Spirodela intermedia]CAA6661883.1 unnamed protein product [Spirodela intermedia]
MEKEILEVFAVAKKAGDAAAADGGSSEVARCLDALKQLKKLPLTTKELVATKVGKGILCLTKHPQKKIQTAASELRQHWKDLVLEEAANKSKKSNPPGEPSPPLKAAAGVKPNKSAAVQNSGESLKPERNSREFIEMKNGVSERVNNGTRAATREEKLPPPPPKLSSMVKCNDDVRDKFREMVAEALARVPGEVAEELKTEAAAHDPIRVALGKSTGAHKARYRSILFNMRDPKNPDLRRRVLLGEVTPAELVGMAPEEMASDDRKRQNQQIKDKAIFECERGAPAKATTDQFKCGRCGKRKTTYYQLQTRSADEPMTTFVTCVECNNHWKFC